MSACPLFVYNKLFVPCLVRGPGIRSLYRTNAMDDSHPPSLSRSRAAATARYPIHSIHEITVKRILRAVPNYQTRIA